MNANIDTRAAFCDKCHAAIRQYDTDGGLWLTDCLGGSYDCGAGGLHVAPASVCDARELVSQIGHMNILAISGGRITARETGVTLPVSNGYSVTIDLAGDDTYTVRRVFKRGAKVWIKGERTSVYCDQVGESAYVASCFQNRTFGAHVPSAA